MCLTTIWLSAWTNGWRSLGGSACQRFSGSLTRCVVSLCGPPVAFLAWLFSLRRGKACEPIGKLQKSRHRNYRASSIGSMPVTLSGITFVTPRAQCIPFMGDSATKML
jgi:hypothetical protein